MWLLKKMICHLFSRIKFSYIDRQANVSYFVRFYNSKLGKYSYVSNNCNVFYTDIGNYTSIGLGCQIGGAEHPLDWVSTSPVFQEERFIPFGLASNPYNPYKKTIIGNDVWIGANAIIKAGVTIGDGAVIGSGSIVTKNIGPYEIWAGNPAKMIRKRFDDETITKLLNTQWWLCSDEKIKKLGVHIPDPGVFITEYNK